MFKRIFFLLCGSSLCCAIGSAGVLFTLDPADGQLQAPPGSTVGWGFVVDADPLNWISFTGSALQNLSSTLVGDYVDIIGSAGGPVNGALPSGAPPWIQGFDSGVPTGAGAFLIAPDAVAGSFETGEIVVSYDEFSDDPNTCGSCYLDSGSFTAPFRIDVIDAAAPVPEPSTTASLLLAMLSLLMWRRRAASAS